MLTLGIETSCDETAAAVLEDGIHLRSNVIASQHDIHSKYGGIVPELAGRSHVDKIHFIIREALEQAGKKLDDIDLFAVTQGPGLVGSLLVGLNAAKGLAFATGKPLIGVNHLEGHLLAIFLQEPVEFPFIGLIVSGGHTDLYRVNGFGDYRVLGRSRDDAAGESFDKVAKMLGWGYPGGPIVEKRAREGNPNAHQFPRAWLEKGSLDFSFSGLKTAVRTAIARRDDNGKGLSDADIAAGFQSAVVEVLVAKALSACEQEQLDRVVLTGGVAANGVLRQALQEAANQRGVQCFVPKPILCTDNAAMIACAGTFRYRNAPPPASELLALDAHANFSV
ncbi:tRNA (adenosine(37)-N6)-threonylcarbamoyltransferase complex transferase subunit TsaD [Nitrospina sp. 32_T5]|uniref:tRNA (adenosine(37)-N6)-threonylcarbamoyltransferase complex transferase subunit TsaD n=1 Tax=unclassified Nitrospina TaxID=2638683 RepID=UPI003F9A21A6